MQQKCSLGQFNKIEIIGHTTSLVEVRKIATEPLASLVVKNEDGTFDKSMCHTFILNEIITKVCDYFGAAFSATQKVELAKEMYAQGYFIKDAEWKLFLSRCKSLYYANEVEIKGQLYVPILMQWFNLFINEVLELTYVEAEQRHQRNIQDNVIGAQDRGFESVEAMVKYIEDKKEKEVEKDFEEFLSKKMDEPKKDIEAIKAEQQIKLLASLSETEKIEFAKNQIHAVRRIFDAGERIKYNTGMGFDEAIFLEYTHLFNKTCTIQLPNGTVKEISIHDVAKIIKL